ncbi:MAG: nucleotide sugar dehydrogenase [Pseudomonadota bacterium]
MPTRAITPLRIVVIGLGRVGLVNAACFAAAGHTVVGIDRSRRVVDAINAAKCPFVDQPLERLIKTVVPVGLLTATSIAEHAICDADMIIICVGSPVDHDGQVDLSQLQNAAEKVGRALSNTASNPCVILRSTVPPGTTSNLFIPVLERASGLKHGHHFHVAFVPEFLREGSAVQDFQQANRTVIGVEDDRPFGRVANLFAASSEHVFKTSFSMAELAKLTDNAWHSLKVSFANELGNLAMAINQDGRELLDILCSDSKLNISPAYLKPGFAFGGPCLPKDLKMLRSFANQSDIETPVLKGVETGNDSQIERARKWVLKQGVKRIALVGAKFKSDTNRLIGSPQIELVMRLQQSGLSTTIYISPDIEACDVTETSASYRLSDAGGGPSISRDLEGITRSSDLILLGNISHSEYVKLKPMLWNKAVLDLVGFPELCHSARSYFGINWPNGQDLQEELLQIDEF